MSAKKRAGRVLLVDIGNSRLKWALAVAEQGAFERRGVMTLEALHATGERAALDRLLRRVAPVQAIHVCSVAGENAARRLRAATRELGLPRPRFVRSAARGFGVRNGYREPWRLGVDRWVALIGAHHDYPDAAACIVNVGTALTIDLMDAQGRHQGGCIVPSPNLMIGALLQNTAGIRRRAGGQRGARRLERSLGTGRAVDGGLFAHDTEGALLAGASHACARLIDGALTTARDKIKSKPRLILAGGGADAVAPLLRARFERQDDLVLRGLAIVARGDIA